MVARIDDPDAEGISAGLFELATALQAHTLHEHLSIGDLVSRVRAPAVLVAARDAARAAEFLGETFAAAVGQWTPRAIAADRVGFRRDVAELLAMFGEVVRREEEELYPAVREVLPDLVSEDEATMVVSLSALRAAGLR